MMLIYACTLLITTIRAMQPNDLRHFVPNVGTVLFTASDMQKRQWTKSELSLLRARRYFQTLLPPPIFINTFNEDYVNILLGYFRDAYASIKRESADPETDTIMTTALSDAIGGYLKVWVLPIAKLDYYGGTVSQQNVIKLFQFYNEIKRYLDTDGTGWRRPDENVLNSITINVAPLKLLSNTRSMKDPCENLAYFEKTPDGLGIPIPNVNWNDKSSTMFIPLKNVSLIMLNNPNTAHHLMKYYDAARSCIQFSNPQDQDIFDEKFQEWLANEIVPHLKDDELYLALGSVLTLVNRTRDLCNNVIDTYGSRYNAEAPPKTCDLGCKKMWIITIILIIEIAWCIPALLYILCAKKSHNKKDCTSNVYLYLDGNKFDKNPKATSFKTISTCVTELPPTENGEAPSSCLKSGLKGKHRSHHSNMEAEGQCPSKAQTCVVGNESYSDSGSRELPGDVRGNDDITLKISDSQICKKSALKKSSRTARERCNSTQLVVLSSHDAFNIGPQRSEYSYATLHTPPAPCSSPILGQPLSVLKSRRRREKDEYRRLEKQRFDDCSRSERRKTDEIKKQEDRRKLEDSRKQEAYRKAEENRKLEEFRKHEACKKAEENRKLEEFRKHEACKKAEENRKLEEFRKHEACKKAEENRKLDEMKKVEERRKAEECKKREKLEECRKVEACRKLEKQEEYKKHKSPEEYKKVQDRKKVEERRKLDEIIKHDEVRKHDDVRKHDECREVDECRKLEDHRKAEESRRHKKPEYSKKPEHSKKLEESRKLEENKKIDEGRKLEEARQLQEYKRVEECRKIDKLFAESMDYCEDKDVCRLFDECRDLNHLADSKKRDEYNERSGSRTEESCIVSEIKYDTSKSPLEYQECCAYEETVDVVECLDTGPCRKPCPCTDCMTKGCFDSTSNSTCREVTSESPSGSKCLSDKQVETKNTRFQVTKELRTVRTSTKQITKSSVKPYLEITIDRPVTEICVDITRQHKRPSRIPKLASSVFTSKLPSTSNAPVEKHKSLIPQLKKKTVDDMAIAQSRCSRSSESAKLNDTF
ncbi:uncharacterized protein LOC110384302 [Helicoverpa armigera]|uniref:uncharacterized protein LOC110384302 n=1 Tax=Helicoverpa armigera TaxID=29058 RepID=UPI003083C28B